MEDQVKEMYERIVGDSSTYTLKTVLQDYRQILHSHHGDFERALEEIEYDMNFVMSRRGTGRYV